MKKRIADWLEKISVASFAVGVFQAKWLGLVIAVIALFVCLKLTIQLESKQ